MAAVFGPGHLGPDRERAHSRPKGLSGTYETKRASLPRRASEGIDGITLLRPRTLQLCQVATSSASSNGTPSCRTSVIHQPQTQTQTADGTAGGGSIRSSSKDRDRRRISSCSDPDKRRRRRFSESKWFRSRRRRGLGTSVASDASTWISATRQSMAV